MGKNAIRFHFNNMFRPAVGEHGLVGDGPFHIVSSQHGIVGSQARIGIDVNFGLGVPSPRLLSGAEACAAESNDGDFVHRVPPSSTVMLPAGQGAPETGSARLRSDGILSARGERSVQQPVQGGDVLHGFDAAQGLDGLSSFSPWSTGEA